MKGKKIGLNDKNYRRLRIVISLSVILLLKIIFPIISLGIIILISWFMYIAYNDGQVNYNLPVYICWWFYYCFCAVHIVATVFSYVIILMIGLLYIKFRLDQINQKYKLIHKGNILNEKLFNASIPFTFMKLKRLIDEHYDIAFIIVQLNEMFNKIVAIIYIGMTIAIDISIYIVFYGHNSYVRFLSFNLAVLLLIGTYFIAYASASLITKAHWAYPLLNSLIAKNKIPLKYKFKVQINEILLFKLTKVTIDN